MCVLIYVKRITVLHGIKEEERAGERKLKLQGNGMYIKMQYSMQQSQTMSEGVTYSTFYITVIYQDEFHMFAYFLSCWSAERICVEL